MPRSKPETPPTFMAEIANMTMPQLLSVLAGQAVASAVYSEPEGVDQRERRRQAEAKVMACQDEIISRTQLTERVRVIVERLTAEMLATCAATEVADVEARAAESAALIGELVGYGAILADVATAFEGGARRFLAVYDENVRLEGIGDEPGIKELRAGVALLDRLNATPPEGAKR